MNCKILRILGYCLFTIVLQAQPKPVKENKQLALESRVIDSLFSNVELEHLEFNSTAVDIWPRFYQDNLVITSNRKRKGNADFFNLFILESQMLNQKMPKLKRFGGNLQSTYNDASCTFTKDGNTVYFTRSTPLPNGNKRGYDYGLNIYKSIRKGKRWKRAKPLVINNMDYSTANPALSPNEKMLYFVSNMPGGKGGNDIYAVQLFDDGSLGEPKNLGNQVNTSGNETSPFITENNILIFASNGHKGNGGLDLFAYNLNDGENGKVINLGKHINSPGNDYGLVYKASQKKGFFNSDRERGNNDADIYRFSKKESFLKVIKDADEIVKTKVLEEELANQLKGESKENEIVSQENKLNKSKEPLLPAIGENLVAYLNLSPLEFNFDSFNLEPTAKSSLQDLADYLKQYPSIKLLIVGHTDHIGLATYNKMLSEKRAIAVKNFLTGVGILSTRIQIKSMGEEEPLVACNPCSKEQLKINRRVEIKSN